MHHNGACLTLPSRNTRTNVRFDGCLHVLMDLGYLPSHWQGVSERLFFLFVLVVSRFCLLCGRFTFLDSLIRGWETSKVDISSWMCVHSACSARSFILYSCFVLAALTTRLTDSVGHPSARNSLAVPTSVMAIAGPLKTSTSGCCWISTRSSRASRSSVVDNARSSTDAPRRILYMAAWRICELVRGSS